MITDYNENLRTIFNHYGKIKQEEKLVEECAELIRAVMRKDTENFIEELADVQVIIDQFTLKYPTLYRKITELKHKKAQRTIERINANK